MTIATNTVPMEEVIRRQNLLKTQNPGAPVGAALQKPLPNVPAVPVTTTTLGNSIAGIPTTSQPQVQVPPNLQATSGGGGATGSFDAPPVVQQEIIPQGSLVPMDVTTTETLDVDFDGDGGASAWMGTFKDDPESAIKHVQGKVDTLVQKDYPGVTPEEKVEWFQDPKLWSAVAGLLTAAAGGSNLEDALMYSLIGGKAGMDEEARQKALKEEGRQTRHAEITTENQAAREAFAAEQDAKQGTVASEVATTEAKVAIEKLKTEKEKSRYVMSVKGSANQKLMKDAYNAVLDELELKISNFEPDVDTSSKAVNKRVKEVYKQMKSGKFTETNTTMQPNKEMEAYLATDEGFAQIQERYNLATPEQQKTFLNTVNLTDEQKAKLQGL